MGLNVVLLMALGVLVVMYVVRRKGRLSDDV